MEHTQEELQEMVQGIVPEVIEQEPVYATSRPLLRAYHLEGGVVIRERITYRNSADSDSWAGVLKTELSI